jgi:hypothetical protein
MERTVGRASATPPLARDEDSARFTKEAALIQAIELLSEVASVACEQQDRLSLTSLANYLDLYRTYLEHQQALRVTAASDVKAHNLRSGERVGILKGDGFANDSVPSTLPPIGIASFERFLQDPELLALAAAEATRESGSEVAVPPSL